MDSTVKSESYFMEATILLIARPHMKQKFEFKYIQKTIQAYRNYQFFISITAK